MEFLSSLGQQSQKPKCTTVKRGDVKVIYLDTTTSSKSWLSGDSQIDEKLYNEFFNQYKVIDPNETLVINIKTTGGYCMWCLLIAHILHKHKGETIAEIENYAFSGGTVIALACDRIKMTNIAALGPINPYSLIPFSTKHTSKLQEKFNWISIVHEYMSDREVSIKDTIENILLKTGYSSEDSKEIINFFMYKYEHNTPITYDMLPEMLKAELMEPIVVVPQATPQVPFDLANLMKVALNSDKSLSDDDDE